MLSCLAALQGAILLIAAKRSDQIASELAQHDFAADQKTERLVEELSTDFKTLQDQQGALDHKITELQGRQHV